MGRCGTYGAHCHEIESQLSRVFDLCTRMGRRTNPLEFGPLFYSRKIRSGQMHTICALPECSLVPADDQQRRAGGANADAHLIEKRRRSRVGEGRLSKLSLLQATRPRQLEALRTPFAT